MSEYTRVQWKSSKDSRWTRVHVGLFVEDNHLGPKYSTLCGWSLYEDPEREGERIGYDCVGETCAICAKIAGKEVRPVEEQQPIPVELMATESPSVVGLLEETREMFKRVLASSQAILEIVRQISAGGFDEEDIAALMREHGR